MLPSITFEKQTNQPTNQPTNKQTNKQFHSGERLKNDPNKIKKAMKRKANKKAKSALAWKSRMDKTKDAMKDRQKIRRHNLDQRKLGGVDGANLSKKRINKDENDVGVEVNGKKRRRMGPYAEKNRAGFEGKKQGFINKDKSATVTSN